VLRPAFAKVQIPRPHAVRIPRVGELDLNDVDKTKSAGFLYPEAQLVINKQGELQWNLVGNPWKLFDIIDWKGTPGID
jgi:hypothetical protein